MPIGLCRWEALHFRQVVKQSVAQTLEHPLVLILHPLLRHSFRLVNRVGSSLRRKDGPLDKEVGGQDRTRRTRVLCLDVKQPSSVTNIVVVAEERRTL